MTGVILFIMVNFNNWQYAVIFLIAFSLIIEAYKHGELKKPEKYDFFKTFFYTAVALYLYCRAGLFS